MEIPALTKAEVADRRVRDPRPDGCELCQRANYPVPHWPQSSYCRSSYRRGDDGVERLTNTHCTCDWCW